MSEPPSDVTRLAGIFMQMWAAYLSERAGVLGDCFGCATPDKAIAHHEIREAILTSQRGAKIVALAGTRSPSLLTR